MSDFDLKLDRFSKFSTVVIGVLGFVATFYVTFGVILPGHLRDTAAACFSHQRSLEGSIKEEPQREINTFKIGLTRICNITEDEAEAFLQDTKTKFSTLAESVFRSQPAPMVDITKMLGGFVSLGEANNYQTSNFQNFETGEKALKQKEILKTGTILRARWSINLRTNTKNTESGNNPSLAIIYDNECVRMEEDLPAKPIRGSYWVKVSLVSC